MEPLRICTAWRGQGECLACDGRENAFFAGLAPDVVAGMHVDVDNTALPEGMTLYTPQSDAEYVWVLRTGAVKLLATAWDGSQRIVRVLKAGDVAGLEALLAGRFSHTAVLFGDVHACRVPLAAVRQLCFEHPGFQWNLMQRMQAALRETEQWLVDLASPGASARTRMARLLLRLRDGESTRIYNFSREELGLMLGVTIETASRIAAAFQRERLIVRRESGGRFFAADIVGLERIAHGN
ncbi:Crp/Fnr family transcriptional regulator [Propionivibrio dicarboxylicus]|uniref:cAMP-binding domain of CRP or a regulatory subunit of cAMP-dependent protein kinases n=1 Tax=Propionivibrio dicarboxylicus TaxID=83767 RepID=A0A1G7XMI8_9RHOO|nr:Crp/Fnr family transcriptional regulator [Propionivibrio dicarboxylicus]SDG85434.1 cAMP-binding domain of CRP or a regulatory subunit of cAMP-dependent protein kinases [Propionivibrio dicarboxylicus]